MDCLEALEWMDAGDAADPGTAPLVQSAREHVSTCAQCQQAWPVHAAWSQLLDTALPAVPIPAGLRERLHSACATSCVQPAAAQSPARPARSPGRRVFWSVSLTAVLLLFAFGLRTVWMPLPAISLPQMYAGAGIEISTLPEFQGAFEPRLPASWSSAFVLDRTFVRGYPEAGTLGGQVAIVPFQYTLRGGTEPLKGRLMMVPRSRFNLDAEAPAEPSLPPDFSAAEVRYLPGGRGACLVWSEDDLVFVCLMASGPADLHRFQRALTGSRSLT